MKTLIYTVVFGPEEYFKACDLMLGSLMDVGYTGDVVMLTDKPEYFPGISAIQIPPDCLPKAAISLVMDVSKYDRILYVDTDVLFLKSPAPLFNFPTALAVSSINFELAGDAFTNQHVRAKIKKGMHTLNSGTVGFKGETAATLLAEWNSAWLRLRKNIKGQGGYGVHMFDQPVLAHLLYDILVTPFWHYNTRIIGFPMLPYHGTSDQNLLVHFVGHGAQKQSREKCLEAMVAYLQKSEVAHVASH